MPHHGGQFFDDDLTGRKLYDRKLIGWLMRFARDYRGLIILATLLLLLTSAGQILFPYLEKFAIDRYIVKNYRLLENISPQDSLLKEYEKQITVIQDTIYFINFNRLSHPERVALEREGIVSDTGYILGDIAGNREKLEILKKHRKSFIFDRKHFAAKLSAVEKIPKEELRILRIEDLKGIVRLTIIFFIVAFLVFIFQFAQVYSITYVGQKVMYNIRQTLFEHMLSLSLRFFDKNPLGRLVTRCTNDVNALNEMFTSVITSVFKDIFIIVGLAVVMLVLNWRLALVSFTLLPVIVGVTYFFRKLFRRAYRLVRQRLASLNTHLSEDISGIRVTKLFAKEEAKQSEFDSINQKYYKANMKLLVSHATFSPVITMLRYTGVALVLWYGGGNVMHNLTSLGSLVAFLSYIGMFYQPIRDLAEKFNIIQSAMAAAERVQLILKEEPDIKNAERAIIPDSIRGKIEFRRVSFAYDTENVLNDVSFAVEPGESVAFVGATGAGKTTIISLLSRFYDVQKGEILIDGINIQAFDIASLRRQIAVVLQDVFLFTSTIRRNICLDKEITDEQLWEILEYVNAADFVRSLPGGLDEPVMERGATFSAGERQLLAFARALVFDPKILVLDEATSNIDTDTELLIQDALGKLMQKRTSIIIAHRLSTIQRVNKIFVIHHGRIRESGNHQELLSKRGLYYDLYRLQYE